MASNIRVILTISLSAVVWPDMLKFLISNARAINSPETICSSKSKFRYYMVKKRIFTFCLDWSVKVLKLKPICNENTKLFGRLIDFSLVLDFMYTGLATRLVH